MKNIFWPKNRNYECLLMSRGTFESERMEEEIFESGKNEKMCVEFWISFQPFKKMPRTNSQQCAALFNETLGGSGLNSCVCSTISHTFNGTTHNMRIEDVFFQILSNDYAYFTIKKFFYVHKRFVSCFSIINYFPIFFNSHTNVREEMSEKRVDNRPRWSEKDLFDVIIT